MRILNVPIEKMASMELTNNKTKYGTSAAGYLHFLILPLKFATYWEWFRKPEKYYEIIINNTYVAAVLFLTVNLLISLAIHIYSVWTDMMSSLDLLSEGFPLIVVTFLVSYFYIHKKKFYELIEYMNMNFKWHSARGVTHMTMQKSYNAAKKFTYLYTACTFFSVTTYIVVPIVLHLLTNHSLPWAYDEVTQTLFIALIFLRQCLVQAIIALSIGQLGVFFASSSILLCGQLDLLCCSLRNLRYTALLKNGVRHKELVARFANVQEDEKHNYSYNEADVENSCYNFDENIKDDGYKTHFDIYDSGYDNDTCSSMEDCAKLHQVINEYKTRFEKFVSPLLVVRVVHCTIYLCTLLYTASVKFDLAIFEYLVALTLDIFLYCYYGNQIIMQANRVSLAAYQSAWPTMGTRPRRMLLNILLSNRRPLIVRAGGFLAIDLQTFLLIMKTSFSYYTLLVNVNEKKGLNHNKT